MTTTEYPTPEFIAARERHLRNIGREDLLDIDAVRKHLRAFRAKQNGGSWYDRYTQGED